MKFFALFALIAAVSAIRVADNSEIEVKPTTPICSNTSSTGNYATISNGKTCASTKKNCCVLRTVSGMQVQYSVVKCANKNRDSYC